jgi:holo-[acyl-carrier protein] synthase
MRDPGDEGADLAILGLGVDIVALERIERLHERHGDAFIRRICRDGECQPRRGPALIEHLGGLFAAKEATLKALGTGWAQGLGLRQVEVVHAPGGAPSVRLHDAAAERSRRLGATTVHLSITHEHTHAVAVAVVEGKAPSSDEESHD